MGANGVDMDRHGLILWENGAGRLRKVLEYLPGLRDAIKKSKIAAKVKKYKKTKNYRIIYIYIYIYRLPIDRLGRQTHASRESVVFTAQRCLGARADAGDL